MRIALNAVSKRPALDRVTLAYATGEAVLARAETEQRPTVLGLLASGRMRPSSGTVTIDGEPDASALRNAVALVDAPDVSDPAPNVTVASVAAEELMFAGRPSGGRAVGDALAELGMAERARDAIGQVPPTVRIRLLVELALLRDGVRGIVLTSPDRHGGDPNAWWRIALDVASRGYAVLVIAGDASAAAIAASSLVERLGTPWAEQAPDDDPTRDDSDAVPLAESSYAGVPDVISQPVPGAPTMPGGAVTPGDPTAPGGAVARSASTAPNGAVTRGDPAARDGAAPEDGDSSAAQNDSPDAHAETSDE
ncbi:hypothetical protein [Humibacter sp.]|uniref:hypothetical protein n=1 Tax=Humibacter sp. TaxID=1940291 RepID=UPI002B664C4D|nr:hypothetical protein [Humibacter sp.]HVX08452.1 hypothetical protein [Humibacter sp.]